MVNPRGRVMFVHQWEVEMLRKQGCKLIINPREEYYPEHDVELNKVTTKGDIYPDMTSDSLPVEEL